MAKQTEAQKAASAAALAKAREATAQGKAPKPKPEPRPCRCGCGDMTKGGEFAMGHDARHKSNLVNAALKGDPDATAELEARSWTHFLEKARNRPAPGEPRPSKPRAEVIANDQERAQLRSELSDLMRAAFLVLRKLPKGTRPDLRPEWATLHNRESLMSKDGTRTIWSYDTPSAIDSPRYREYLRSIVDGSLTMKEEQS